MWKTQLFPQVFARCPGPAFLCKNCVSRGHPSAVREQHPEQPSKRNLENLRQKVPIPPRLFERKRLFPPLAPKNL